MSIKDKYAVKSIKPEITYDWLLFKHYAKRLPPISYAFGLYKENILYGVITFGTPVSSTLRDIINGYKLLELNRLVNEDDGKNILSYFVSQSLKMLPKPTVIVSYADSSKGHHGYIYQATNWVYTGLSIPFKDICIEGMENLHHTTIEDITRGKTNRVATLKQIFGDKLYYKERDRKHRYIYFLGNKNQIKEMKSKLKYPILPYPKGDNKRYDASYKPLQQPELFY